MNYAKDPICGMTVDAASALHAERDGQTYTFCSDRCRQTFLSKSADRERDENAAITKHVTKTPGTAMEQNSEHPLAAAIVKGAKEQEIALDDVKDFPSVTAGGVVGDVADRLTDLDGKVALFSHSHLGRVLAAPWIGLSVEHAQHFLLNTASLSLLCYEHDRTDKLAIALWNSPPLESFATVFNRDAGSVALNEPSIEQWENEGGEITLPLQNAGKITL